MRHFNILFGATLAMSALMAPSCTISQPDEPEGNAGSYLLQKVTMMGMPQMYITYDAQMRPTKLSYPFGEAVVTMEYNGADKYPTTIDRKFYNDSELDDHYKWTNIDFNINGAITSFTNTDMADGEISYSTLRYDSNGHLTSITTDGSLEVKLDWASDGTLTRVNYIDDNEHTDFTYGDVKNTAGVWSANMPVVDVLLTLGYYGTAPSKFPATATNYADGETEMMRFAYSISPAGLITAEKVGFSYNSGKDEDYVATFNYTYIKK